MGLSHVYVFLLQISTFYVCTCNETRSGALSNGGNGEATVVMWFDGIRLVLGSVSGSGGD